MIVQGTIVYDPVHRVSGKQETATRRTWAQTGIGHLARLLPSPQLGGKTLKQAKIQLQAVSEDPYVWTRLGKDQAGAKAVAGLYELLAQIQADTADTDLKTFLTEVENRLSKTESRPWTAIIKVDPNVVNAYLKDLRSQGIAISQPAWGPHVTFVRGERPPNTWGFDRHDGPPKWNLFNGLSITIELDPALQSNAKGHYWLNIVSSKIEGTETDLRGLRYALGLTVAPRIPLHLTIGKAQ
jgi:hypothetical protein